ncbi:MAG: PorT family protein [Tannerella sp.]|jgi:hypothetical protein|nr:PorT family protein [Tannerella sp.]
MKKYHLAILMAWLPVFAANVQAQPQTSTEIRIAANLSGYDFRNRDNIMCAMKTGLTIGGVINFPVTDYFSLQSELSMNYKVSEIGYKETNIFNEYQYFSVEMPMYAILKKRMKHGKIFAGAGLFAGAGIKAGFAELNLYEDELIKPIDFGATVIAGYELHHRLCIYAGMQKGLVNLYNVGGSNAGMTSRTYFIGIACKLRGEKEERITVSFLNK